MQRCEVCVQETNVTNFDLVYILYAKNQDKLLQVATYTQSNLFPHISTHVFI